MIITYLKESFLRWSVNKNVPVFGIKNEKTLENYVTNKKEFKSYMQKPLPSE